MREDFLSYYERELTVLRQLGAEFAEKYPKIASRLLLEPNRCGDPHVERMIEAFALLAARVHLKIDDEFPEISEALLSVVYPRLRRYCWLRKEYGCRSCGCLGQCMARAIMVLLHTWSTLPARRV